VVANAEILQCWLPYSCVPAPTPSPHDPYDKFSDHLRFAAQQLAKYRDSLKRTVSLAPVERARESEEYGAKMWNQGQTRGMAATTDRGGAREAIARGDWEGSVRMAVRDVRRLLPGVKEGEASQEVRLLPGVKEGEASQEVPERRTPAIRGRSRRGTPNSGPKSRRLAELTGSSPRPPKRRSRHV
jgi:hypothetical protein